MKLHIVRLGAPIWNAAFKRDASAWYAWLDLHWYRICLIGRVKMLKAQSARSTPPEDQPGESSSSKADVPPDVARLKGQP